jgi:hypothetical protein
MKRIHFKLVILLAVAIGFAFAGNISADGFGNNNIQQSIEKFGNGAPQNSSGIGLDPPTEPPISGDGSPIGNGQEILLGLGLFYGVYLFWRKRRQESCNNH